MRGAVVVAWLWAVAAAWWLNDWFPKAVSTYYLQPVAVGYAFFVVVSSLAAIPYMLFAAWYRGGVTPSTAAFPLLVAAGWTGGELLRTLGPAGDPWALAGYSQARTLPLVQLADVAGVYGPGFVVVAVNAALARAHRPAGVVTAAIVAIVAVAYGSTRLAEIPPDGGTTAVSIVQGNIDVGSQWNEDLYGRHLGAYLRLTHEALERDRPSLVVWPESAVTFFLDDEALYREAISYVLQPAGAELVAGGPRTDRASPPRLFNSAFLLSADGRVLGRYDKQSLLPFAEHFPIPGLDLLRRRFGRVREFTPGAVATLLPTSVGPAGVVICNEALFAPPAAARVAQGAALVIAITNDSWLADARYGEQALDMAILRAVEQRRFVVRASTAGPSAIVDPAGRIVARTSYPSAAVVAGRVAARSERTPYSRVGDAFGWTCIAVAGLSVAGRRRRAA
jgi:apolipoprotein N-acyltransferase